MNQESLRGVVRRVARAAGVRARLVVLRDSCQRAWTDGETVYVTTTLVSSLPEPEVAAVVAHELAHIIGRHVPNTKQGIEDLRTAIHDGQGLSAGIQGAFARVVVEAAITIAHRHRSR